MTSLTPCPRDVGKVITALPSRRQRCIFHASCFACARRDRSRYGRRAFYFSSQRGALRLLATALVGHSTDHATVYRQCNSAFASRYTRIPCLLACWKIVRPKYRRSTSFKLRVSQQNKSVGMGFKLAPVIGSVLRPDRLFGVCPHPAPMTGQGEPLGCLDDLGRIEVARPMIARSGRP